MEVEAAPPRPREDHTRLVVWGVFVGLIALINYAARFSGGSGGGRGVSHQEVYSYSTFAGGALLYAIWLGIILLIVKGRFDLLALRAPRAWGVALRLAGGVIAAIFLWEAVISYLPLPESPARSRGSRTCRGSRRTPARSPPTSSSSPSSRRSSRSSPFAASASRCSRFSAAGRRSSSSASRSVLAHGLVEALLVLVPFGIALAWLRDRTDSVVPGMFVHGLFNAAALIAIVLS